MSAPPPDASSPTPRQVAAPPSAGARPLRARRPTWASEAGHGRESGVGLRAQRGVPTRDREAGQRPGAVRGGSSLLPHPHFSWFSCFWIGSLALRTMPSAPPHTHTLLVSMSPLATLIFVFPRAISPFVYILSKYVFLTNIDFSRPGAIASRRRAHNNVVVPTRHSPQTPADRAPRWRSARFSPLPLLFQLALHTGSPFHPTSGVPQVTPGVAV